MEICYNNCQWDPIRVCERNIKCGWMHLLKMLLRCISAVGCIKKRHAPRCIHKTQAILSVYQLRISFFSWVSHVFWNSEQFHTFAEIRAVHYWMLLVEILIIKLFFQRNDRHIYLLMLFKQTYQPKNL